MSGAMEILVLADKVDQMCETYEEMKQIISDFVNTEFNAFYNCVILFW